MTKVANWSSPTLFTYTQYFRPLLVTECADYRVQNRTRLQLVGEGTGVTCSPINFPRTPTIFEAACACQYDKHPVSVPSPLPPHQNYDHAEMADLPFSRPLGIYGSTVNSGIPQRVYRCKILRPRTLPLHVSAAEVVSFPATMTRRLGTRLTNARR